MKKVNAFLSSPVTNLTVGLILILLSFYFMCQYNALDSGSVILSLASFIGAYSFGTGAGHLTKKYRSKKESLGSD